MAVFITTPAHDDAVGTQTAGVRRTSAYCGETLVFRDEVFPDSIISPTDDNAIRTQSAGILVASAYRSESLIVHFFWCFTGPADSRAIFTQSTDRTPTIRTTHAPNAYGFQRFIVRRCGLFVAPADHPVVITQSARLVVTAAYGDETLILRRLIWVVRSPAYSDSIRTKPASMIVTCAYGNKAFTSRRCASPSPAGNLTVFMQSASVIIMSPVPAATASY